MSAHNAIESRAVVFDCDGVLTNAAGVWDRAYAQLLPRYGIALTRRLRTRLATTAPHQIGHVLAEAAGLPGLASSLGDELLALIADNAGSPVAELHGATSLVRALAGAGRRLAVASDSPTPIVRGHLDRIGLLHELEAVVGCDPGIRPKPAPDLYRVTCALLEAEPADAIALEDSRVGVAAAHAAGLFVIAIADTSDADLGADASYSNLADPGLLRRLGVDTPSARAA